MYVEDNRKVYNAELRAYDRETPRIKRLRLQMEASNKVTNDNSAVKGSFTQGRGKVTRDAHYLFTYTPIFFFAAHLQNTLSIKQVRAPRDDGSDVNYDESYNEPYDNSAEVFIIDHPPSSTAERRDPVVIQSSDGTSSKRPRSNIQ